MGKSGRPKPIESRYTYLVTPKPIESRYTYLVTPKLTAVEKYLDGRPRAMKVTCLATSPKSGESKVRKMLPEGDWLIQLISVTETRGDWNDEDVDDD